MVYYPPTFNNLTWKWRKASRLQKPGSTEARRRGYTSFDWTLPAAQWTRDRFLRYQTEPGNQTVSFPSLWPESQTITTIPLKKARMGRENNNSLSYFSYPLIPGSQYELLIQGWYTQPGKNFKTDLKPLNQFFSLKIRTRTTSPEHDSGCIRCDPTQKKILKNRKTFANKLAGILLHWKFSSQQFNTSFKKITTIRTKILLTSDTLILTKPSLCLRLWRQNFQLWESEAQA